MTTQKIEINGKQLPVKYTYSALMELEQTLQKPFAEIAQDMTKGGISSMVHIAHVGLKHGARIAKQEFEMTVEEVGDLLDPDLIERFAILFGDSFAPVSDKSEKKNASKKK